MFSRIFKPVFISKNSLNFIKKYSSTKKGTTTNHENTFLTQFRSYPFYYTYYIPCFIGAGIGGIFGSIEGFKRTHKDSIFINCVSTFGEGCLGICIGFYAGLFWPFTISIMTARQFYKEQDKQKDKIK